MNLLLNLLKAFGIVIGAYLLLYAGLQVVVAIVGCYLKWRFGDDGELLFGGVGCPDLKGIAITASLVLLAFGALYLPPKGRLYAAIGALSLILGLLIFCGFYFAILISNTPHD